MERLYPPYKPHEPRKPLKEWYVERKYIYQFSERIWGDDEERFDNYDDEDEYAAKQKKKVDPSKISLAWLLDKLPKGITPEQVKIDLNYEARSSYSHSLGFYYEVQTAKDVKHFERDLAKYENEFAKYQIDLKQYEIDKKNYDEWERQEKIKEAKQRLKELEGK